MRIRCRLLTAYEDALGRAEVELDLEEGATVDRLLDEILSRHAEITLTPGLPAVLLDEAPADPGARVGGHDEVALLPIMLGG